MYAVIQLKNIEGLWGQEKSSIYSKIEEYEYLGSFENLVDIEKKYKNYYPHKYRLKDYGWCYFVRKTNEFKKDTDSHLLADKVIFDLDFEFKEFYDYQYGNLVTDGHSIISRVIRDIKLNMIL